MFNVDTKIAGFDDELNEAIKKEIVRQEEHIELIASENYASPRVLEAQGSVLTNKYAEGYPYKRYYGGCENVDVAEQLARKYNYEILQPCTNKPHGLRECYILDEDGYCWVPSSKQD